MFNNKKNNQEKEELLARQEAELQERIKKETNTYIMPRQAQDQSLASHDSRRTGILIISGGIIFLLAMIVVFYYAFFYEKKESPPAETNIPASQEERGAPTSPEVTTPNAPEPNLLNPSSEETETTSTNTQPIIATSTTPATASNQEADEFDSDRDGLSDREELLLGSDSESIDSDTDGYSDYSEVMNLYDPAGAGKLSSSLAIGQFISQDFGYSFLYPFTWPLTKVGGSDDSLVIRSSDNHFLRMIVQTNSTLQSIEDWYRAQFKVTNIPTSQKEQTSKWQGIRSEDGLILYLTDNERNYIYILSYTPTGDTEYYRNIFEMMIKSFEI